MRLTLPAYLLLGALAAALPASAQAPAPQALPVGTTPVQVKPVTQSTDFVGRVEAMQRVDIRARVTGFLQDVAFKEGDLVKEGDVLYRIEPDTFQAAQQQARGTLVQAQATFANATLQRARTQELVKSNTAPQAQLDERVAAEQNAQGQIVIADANLKQASINLGYTTITAPISGEIGRTKFTKGALIGPDSGPLTIIVTRDPMYVVFPVSQREFLKAQEEERREKQTTLAVRIRFSDGTLYDQTGKIDFVDVSVDRATDTVTVRATIPNPAGQLIDGQLVRVAVQAEKPQDRVLVPQAALIVDQQGPYVFIVKDGKAAIQRVTLGGDQGPYSIIDKGLTGGEQVVVQGMENLRAGTPVQASPVPPPPDGT
jgi:membrane fusion protein, multidrug efflux system